LPDKAVSLIDTACARVAISQHATPPEIEDCRRRIYALETELRILDREVALGLDHTKRQEAVGKVLDADKAILVALEERLKAEKALVDKVLDLRAKLSPAVETKKAAGPEQAAKPGEKPAADKPAAPAPAAAAEPVDRPAVLAELRKTEKELKEFQGESPLILPSVDEQAVASVLADWTGIPVGRMVKNEIQAVLNLADSLEKRVIQTARARLDNPGKPIGVFMLAGPSGVGKTETALTLAEALYGGETNVITINMSEFQEAHTVSTLKGAPPGYVGYGEGGILTEAVRRRPYSVVLLDEVEKAHTDVHEIFFQVFDKGMMEDGEGRLIDFKNTIILLTTNAGSDLIMNMCKDPDLLPDPEGIAKALRTPLLKIFPAALLGRLVVIPYYPLSDAMLKSIIRLQLGRIEKRVRENHNVVFSYDDSVVNLIASRCTELESGGRMVDAILTQTLLPEVSKEFLNRLMEGSPVASVAVSAKDGNFQYTFS
jgi:type VI secretion system protein VasG